MSKIKLLPENVARKIAAGEVIERPASVVKELCENAFDAGAKNVSVELWDGGLSLIRVRDDGRGMELEDLKLCYLPHATSKIRDENDLLKISTWGFRGEALASIAAVSELIISSRAKEALIGGRIRVKHGKLLSFAEKGLPPGTTVEVLNLFENVPARRAFLKSPRAEASKVSELVRLLAFENPRANLTLSLGERETFRYEAAEGRLGLLAKSSGLKKEAFLVEEFEEGPYRLQVILSRKEHPFPTGRHLYLLVNDRIVKDRLLTGAALEGLRPLFPRGHYPALVLALYLPPELVDVNVHPAKWEVRFREEKAVFSLVRKCLEAMTRPKVVLPPPKIEEEEDLPLEAEPEAPWEGPVKVAEPGPAYQTRPLWEAGEVLALAPLGEEFYLLKDGEAVIFFDFHAAQERLLFEDLKEAFKAGKIKKQRFLTPEPLILSAEAFARLEEALPRLEGLGFEIEILAPGEAFLRAAPAVLAETAREALLALLEENHPKEPEGLLEETLARLACRAAKKRGDKVSPPEVKELYRRLKERDLSHCPHGRPIYWSVSLEEVRRRLGRKL